MILRNSLVRLGTGLAAAFITLLLLTSVQAEETPKVVGDTQNLVKETKGPVDIADKWGVEIVGVRLSAGGRLIDFRYKVLDTKKAAPILNRRFVPKLIDQKTKKVISVMSLPKIGRLRQNTMKPKEGRVYFIIFANPGLVKAQSKVTIEVGEFRIENLTVEG